MTAPSILNMHLTQEFRRRQEEKLLRGIALKQAIRGLVVEGSELWGAEWDAWYDKFLDEHAGNDTWGELYDALVLEIERRRNSMAGLECSCHYRPDGPQCPVCAARAAKSEEAIIDLSL